MPEGTPPDDAAAEIAAGQPDVPPPEPEPAEPAAGDEPPAVEQEAAAPREPRVEVEVDVEAPKPAPWYKCRHNHRQQGAFRHLVPDRETGKVVIDSGPVCRACLFAWMGQKFRTRLDPKQTAVHAVPPDDAEKVAPPSEPANDTGPPPPEATPESEIDPHRPITDEDQGDFGERPEPA